MNAPPPSPELCGSTRPSAACTATAASAALPPARSTWTPASTAYGLAAATPGVSLNVDVAAIGAGRPVVSAGAAALRQPPAAAASTKDKASAAVRVRVNSRVGMDERRGRWEGDDNRLSRLPPSRLTLLHANRLFRVALLALA